ncbi:TIMELESS-interacting protein-like [Anneissia japonica]|uniref:TIMELESS-interacting protein-like n=1 Tax=Anneissia japonica TaxID=1529436 RepID=UPI0014257E4B|nr:TIMELESS-interacting protein-like [Anneissia japonica]
MELSDHSVNDDDEYAGTDDDIPPEPQELPPLEMPESSQVENPMEEGDIGAILDAHAATTGAKQTQVRAKRIVRRPQPKLDPARLSGDRGIPMLLKHFEKVKFKGKGYETEDLNTLMHTMEHWAHRLCPRMTFDDIIARVEKLGTKKPVQVCVKKIRLDIPIIDEDIPAPENMGAENAQLGTAEPAVDEEEWNFDDLFADKPTTKEPATPAQPPSPPPLQPISNTLTAEQLKRIEEKKLLAAKRKAARLAQAAQGTQRTEEDQESQENQQEKQENQQDTLENQQRTQKKQECQQPDDFEQSEKQKSTFTENEDDCVMESENNVVEKMDTNEVIELE